MQKNSGLLTGTGNSLADSYIEDIPNENEEILCKHIHREVQAVLDGVHSIESRDNLIALVDEFYERHVTLIISAEKPITQLYTQGNLNFEFKRCISRLQEMQSLEYLAKEHLA